MTLPKDAIELWQDVSYTQEDRSYRQYRKEVYSTFRNKHNLTVRKFDNLSKVLFDSTPPLTFASFEDQDQQALQAIRIATNRRYTGVDLTGGASPIIV
jgi:hypothetical protein